MAKIFLRPVRLADAPLIARWFNDWENVKYMSTLVRCQKHTPATIRKSIREIDPGFERLFIVENEKESEPIGHAGIDNIDFRDKRGEIFFLIGEKKEKGKGYGREIIRQLLDYAFHKLKLNSLLATVTIKNLPAQKVLEKAGFKRVGIRREFNYINRKFLDEIFYDILRKDYLKRKSKKKSEIN